MSNIGRRRATALKQDADTYTRRRREIIEAAAQLFKKNGYAHTSLNDVAEALDSDRATIYYYVASKKELLHEVVRDVVAETAKEALEIQRRSAPAPVKLKELIVALMRAYATNFPYQYVYIQEGIRSTATATRTSSSSVSNTSAAWSTSSPRGSPTDRSRAQASPRSSPTGSSARSTGHTAGSTRQVD